MFADFFQKQYMSRPELSKRTPGSLRGFMEEHRVLIFQSAIYKPQLLHLEPLWSRISGKVYTLTEHYISVVLALYGDGTILWLDDHSSDLDFNTFAYRENLFEWLPHQMNDLLDLLIKTKFNFLGGPQLIASISDVPAVPDQMKEAMSLISEEGVQSVVEAEQRLISVTTQVQPPSCISKQDGSFQLSFCIWTKIDGNIMEFNCSFETDSSFRYEATQLVDSVGSYVTPR